jgi:D-3-phosphoglycerate dehydrogenase
MIAGAQLDLLPRGAWVLNAARGGVVNEADLAARLASGQIGGAGIDTWSTEPKVDAKLLAQPNVLATPHIGASTIEAQIAIGETVLAQVKKAVDGGVVDHPVNLPQIGVQLSPLANAYAVLAEKLGSLIGQVLAFNPSGLALSYRGDLASIDHAVVRMSLMKGYASQVVDGYVSFVNVQSHFERLGIAISETVDPAFTSYKSALKVRVTGAGGEELTVGGVVFDDRYPRISLFNEYFFEIEPTGELVLIENHDRPGVIGDVGQFLAQRGINIDSFHLSRNRKGGRAMAIVKVDSPLEEVAENAMRALANIVAVHRVSL